MDKNILKSKTFWVGLVVALAPVFPPAAEAIKANPEVISSSLGVLFMLLRLISKDKIVIL